MLGRKSLLLLLVAVPMLLSAQTAQQRFAVTTEKLPVGLVGEAYKTELQTANAVPPIMWVIASGHLPPGLALEGKTGIISGIPTEPGTFSFTIGAHDAANEISSRAFVITVETRTLKIIWKDYPVIANGGIQGGVEVENPSQYNYDLTVIIVAVNEYGKAFALGYQHFTFNAGTKQQIPFGTSLPQGRYIVHADAIGEVAARKLIHRARLQTPRPLIVAGGP